MARAKTTTATDRGPTAECEEPKWTPPARPRTLTLSQAAAELGIGTSTAYDLVRDGRWPKAIRLVEIGSQTRAITADIDAFLGPMPGTPELDGDGDGLV